MAIITLVTAMTPMFSAKLVLPLPDPHSPASTQPSPSVPMPLLMACAGGGGAPDILQKDASCSTLKIVINEVIL